MRACQPGGTPANGFCGSKSARGAAAFRARGGGHKKRRAKARRSILYFVFSPQRFRLQVSGLKSARSGKISNRPSSMSAVSTSFERSL